MRSPGREENLARAPSSRVSSAPDGDRRPWTQGVRDPALTVSHGAGIVVSCAQGALGLLPFAVRLGDQSPVFNDMDSRSSRSASRP